MGTVLKIALSIVAVIVVVGGVGGYFYWRYLKSTPQYSLALIVDAARRNDQPAMDQLIDINSVVDDFLPQITGKAVELYGRGLPAETTTNLARIAAPVLPAVKDRAREELPGVISDRTSKFKQIPFAAIVLGADRYLDINVTGEIAEVKSKLQDRTLEVRMQRNGDRWQIVAVKDERLATEIAQKIGQEIIAASASGGIKNAGEKLNVKDLQNVLKQAEELLR